ncbi:MAG: hypothetical protein WDZ35_16385 [Crocinitomicaceae bacterium]
MKALVFNYVYLVNAFNINSLSKENNKSISTEVVEFTIDQQGFLRITMLDTKAKFDLKEAKKQVKVVGQLTNDRKFLALVDMRKSYTVPTIEAKKHIASLDKKIAEAIIINSLGNRIIGNLYLKLINNRYPSKLFSDEDKAIGWLLSHKK